MYMMTKAYPNGLKASLQYGLTVDNVIIYGQKATPTNLITKKW